MKKIITLLFLVMAVICRAGTTYYLDPKGSDNNDGVSVATPFKTLKKALTAIGSTQGCTIKLAGGTYYVTADQFMGWGDKDSKYAPYAVVYPITAKNLTIEGSTSGERAVFDFTDAKFELEVTAVEGGDFTNYRAKPTTCTATDADGVTHSGVHRISAFWLRVDGATLRHFDIVGVQSVCKYKTQSECISARGGSNCLLEDLRMHDGMGIGYYQSSGSNVTVKNCDAYNLYDTVGYGGAGEDTDGFGFHLPAGKTGNKIIGCRAWWCADDGFDCINNKSVIEVENCWAFYNGFKPGGNEKCGNGNGFKIGGFGKPATKPDSIPHHTVKGCIAYYNLANGFYANHHLGGNTWTNNTAYRNAQNFNMTNIDADEDNSKDVPGFGHTLKSNVSYSPRSNGGDYTNIDTAKCTLENNATVTDTKEFVDCKMPTDMASIALATPRNADGSLPDVSFLKAKYGSDLQKNNQGASAETEENPDAPDTPVEVSVTATAVMVGTNPDVTLPTSDNTCKSATWTSAEGIYSFTLASADGEKNTFIRNANVGSGKEDRMIVIDDTRYQTLYIGKGIYNITKSDNVKSIKLYMKSNTTDSSKGIATLVTDYGLTSAITVGSGPLLNATAMEVDATECSNFRVSNNAVVAFRVEYEDGELVTMPTSGLATFTNRRSEYSFALPEGLTAYAAVGVQGETSVMFQSLDDIPVQQGVLLKGTGGQKYTLKPVKSDYKIQKENLMQPVVFDTEIGNEGTDFVLSNGAFYRSAKGTIKQGKSYLKLPATATGKEMKIVFDDNADGVTVIVGDEQKDAPAVKVIKNGRLVIMAGQKEYNVGGRRF